MRSRVLLLVPALALVAAGAAGCGSPSSSSGAVASADGTGFVAGDGSLVVLDPASRPPAPELTGTTLDGSPFSLAEHRGEVVVLNVWASWCAPCRAEAATLQQVAQETAADGVQFVGLDTRDSDTAARAFADRFGITFPSIVDRDGRLQLLFSDTLPPQAIPSTLVVDRQGRIAARALGAVDVSELRGIIEPLVAEGGAAASAAS